MIIDDDNMCAICQDSCTAVAMGPYAVVQHAAPVDACVQLPAPLLACPVHICLEDVSLQSNVVYQILGDDDNVSLVHICLEECTATLCRSHVQF